MSQQKTQVVTREVRDHQYLALLSSLEILETVGIFRWDLKNVTFESDVSKGPATESTHRVLRIRFDHHSRGRILVEIDISRQSTNKWFSRLVTVEIGRQSETWNMQLGWSQESGETFAEQVAMLTELSWIAVNKCLLQMTLGDLGATFDGADQRLQPHLFTAGFLMTKPRFLFVKDVGPEESDQMNVHFDLPSPSGARLVKFSISFSMAKNKPVFQYQSAVLTFRSGFSGAQVAFQFDYPHEWVRK